MTTSAPVTRQITNTDVDAVIVTLTWPQIQVAEDDGDVRGDTVELQDTGSIQFWWIFQIL